jgi:hypothetical protein
MAELNNTNSLSGAEKQVEEVRVSNNNKNPKTPLLEIIDRIAVSVSELARSGKAETVRENVSNILTTIAAMNATEEYEIGIRVGDVLYRFEEYQASAGLAKLVVASKVVLNDVVSAENFYDREKFNIPGKRALSPAEFAKAIHQVCASIRTNPEKVKIVKPSVSLLADSNKYAVNSRKVEDSHQDYITFLRGKYDDEKIVPVTQWAIQKSLTLFS